MNKINSKKLILALASLIFLAVIFVIYGIFSFRSMDEMSSCSEEVLRKIPSPSGELVILLVGKNCGATVEAINYVEIGESKNFHDGRAGFGKLFEAKEEVNSISWKTNKVVEIKVDRKEAGNYTENILKWKEVSIHVIR